jgi:hypothetical protein
MESGSDDGRSQRPTPGSEPGRLADLAPRRCTGCALSRGYASAIRAESRRIQSTAGRRGAADEVPRARQAAVQLVHQARERLARLTGNGIQLLPEPSDWLQTAETEYAAIRREDTPQMWADLSNTWDEVGQPHRKAEAQYPGAEALRQHGDRDRARPRRAVTCRRRSARTATPSTYPVGATGRRAAPAAGSPSRVRSAPCRPGRACECRRARARSRRRSGRRTSRRPARGSRAGRRDLASRCGQRAPRPCPHPGRAMRGGLLG